MNIVIVSGTAYLLPRFCSYLCNYLCDNQNWGQEERFAPLVSCIARRMINGCIAMKRYVVNARMQVPPRTPFKGLAGIYDSGWIVMLLSSRAIPICIDMWGNALCEVLFPLLWLVLPIYINTFRKCVELILVEYRVTFPDFLRTSFFLPRELALDYLSRTARLLIFTFATAIFALTCYALCPFAIEFRVLVLLIIVVWSNTLSGAVKFWIRDMRHALNRNAYLFDYITPRPGEAPPLCPLTGGPMRVPIRLHICGHLFSEVGFLNWANSERNQNHDLICPECERPLEEVI